MPIKLTVPDSTELKPRITVFGVGGAGGNAVNNMIESNLEGVEFVVANTDAQAILQSSADRRIQMGTDLTQGLGAGSQPQIGAGAAEEALPEILDHLAGAHMVFITAGMGGGTGTGAAPVIARAAKEQGILTVGVVTKPFHFEGQRRMLTADRGIEQLTQHVDTLIVIPNQNLFRVANEKTTFAAAFAMADEVLYSGVASITELMTRDGLINLDFADVRAIMSEMGKAMMGTGEASGEKRAIEAAEAAISNPLLDDVSMRGARGLLISISGGPDLTLYEVDEAATRIREEVDPEANIILGATFDEKLEGTMRVSVVATGLAEEFLQGSDDSEVEDDEEEAGYGYATPQPAAKAVAPAPVAPTPQIEEVVEENMEVAAELQEAAAPASEPAPRPAMAESASKPRPQMPAREEFPPIAREQMAAGPEKLQQVAKAAQTKRKGLLERLASVGLGVRRDEEPAPAPKTAKEEPQMQRPQSAAQPQGNVHPLQPAIDPSLDDDQLEIPAFLRRQSN
ncbi:cell division protein FtsZ [Anderseniella sp. Alg231-50]|uniref:cell division protein FtsZ n=1 Tax=Anderseniella sp. Alg231-50 TaxID=1922226 RepID=UPI000D5562EA